MATLELASAKECVSRVARAIENDYAPVCPQEVLDEFQAKSSLYLFGALKSGCINLLSIRCLKRQKANCDIGESPSVGAKKIVNKQTGSIPLLR